MPSSISNTTASYCSIFIILLKNSFHNSLVNLQQLEDSSCCVLASITIMAPDRKYSNDTEVAGIRM